MAVGNVSRMALLFATAFAILELCSCFTYPDLLAINATCFPKDTCSAVKGKGPRLDETNNWKTRNCFCDDLCADYGDCCLDANAYVADEQEQNKDKYECVKLKQFGSLYMRGKCTVGWEDEAIAKLCTHSRLQELSDPLGEMPVTSLDSYVTYKNYYCAICNNDTGAYEIWKPRLECPTLKTYQNLYKNLTHEFVYNELIYQNNVWGLYVQDSEGKAFHRCYVYPVMPPTVVHMVRACKESIKNCSSAWADEKIQNLCHSYTAVRYKLEQPYRNVHCALCNGIEMETTLCVNQAIVRFLNFGNDFNKESFALLLDFTDRSGSNIVGSTVTCQLGEIFDPFFKKCRNVICGRSNQQYRSGRCVNVDSPVSITSTEVAAVDSEMSSTNPTFQKNSTAAVISDTEHNDASVVGDSVDNVTLAVASNDTLKLSSSMDEENDLVEVTGSVSLNASDQFEEMLATPTVNISDRDSAVTESPVALYDYNVTSPGQVLPCEKFLLPTEEYTMTENGTVYVEKYKRTYHVNDYEQSKGGILVCIIQAETEKFSQIMGWVTLGGLGISCLFLVLHLVAFCVVPELRNLSGKNLASLCLVLLGAFSTFILSVFGQAGGTECFILAASMYYFFLSSFCWVNIMAFDVWRTLGLATTELRVSSGKQYCKFMIYAVYGWFFPAAALAAVLLLDIIRPEFLPAQYYPALGEYWCWFGHRKALLVFFAAPLMAIMVLNIILFVLSARIIANTMESTAKMTSCAPYQSQFKLYMRLALLMGLTWISGIVAGYLQVEAIWYVFVLLNTLQGLFIFLAFTCTRKVWHSVRCNCWRRFSRPRRSWVSRSHSSSKQGLQSTNSNVSNLSHTASLPPSHPAPNAQISSD